MNEKVLCVDDDPKILTAFRRSLWEQFQIDTSASGEEALALVARQGPYAVVVADMRMPGMDGVQLLAQLQQEAPDTVRIMLTGNADMQTAVDAVNHGHIFRFLNKPCSTETLALALTAGIRQYQLTQAEREVLESTLGGSIRILTDILSLQDPTTFDRCKVVLGHLRGFQKYFVAGPPWQLEVAGMLYRIGLVTLPPAVLQKLRPGVALTPAEQDLLARVPEMGADLLEHVPRLEPVAQIVRYQNKHFDGSGHPTGAVAGADIPLGARVLKVMTDLVELERIGHSSGSALRLMKERIGWYDLQVFEAVQAWSGDQSAPMDPTQLPCRKVKASELCPGQVLGASIETLDGMMIMAAGSEITPMALQKIRNFATLSGLKEPISVLT